VLALLTVCIGLIGETALAQQSAPSPARVRHFMVPYGAKELVSPDGLMLAYFGEEYPAALYVKNLKTDVKTLIARGPDGLNAWSSVSGMSFSPDGKKLVFEAGARQFVAGIYSVNTDGSSVLEGGPGMTVLASDSEARPPVGRYFDTSISEPTYSADGTKLLVRLLVTNGKRDELGRIDHSEDKVFVGLLSPDSSNQKPEMLVEGTPLFWNHDGSGVYYNKRGVVYRFDIPHKMSKRVLDTEDVNKRTDILGRVPGVDAAFTVPSNQDDAKLAVTSLDGTNINQSLEDFAASLPRRDSDGRVLRSVEEAGPHLLMLRYAMPFGSLMHAFKQGELGQLKESGKLDPGLQLVKFP
jgi:dipeptidyl aminopeptidase/acylaminoacyl peptidase